MISVQARPCQAERLNCDSLQQVIMAGQVILPHITLCNTAPCFHFFARACVSFHFEQTSEVALGGICYLWTESDWLFAPVSRLYIEVSKQTMVVGFISCPRSSRKQLREALLCYCYVAVLYRIRHNCSHRRYYSESELFRCQDRTDLLIQQNSHRLKKKNCPIPSRFQLHLATRSKTHCIRIHAI